MKKNPSMVDNYEKQSEEYVEKNVKDYRTAGLGKRIRPAEGRRICKDYR